MAMTNRQRVTAWLAEALPSSGLEAALLAEGFARTGKSLVYSREGAEVDQRFKLAFDVSPRYEPTALAHVLPNVQLESAVLGELVQQMAGEGQAWVGSDRPPVAVGHQLQNVAPKGDAGQATRWFIRGEADTPSVMEQIGAFTQAWVIPFLNQYRDVRSLIQGYEAGDERLRVPRPLYLYVVAAYLHVHEAAKALTVLDKVFGRPGPRKQYAKAFEYVRGKGASTR